MRIFNFLKKKNTAYPSKNLFSGGDGLTEQTAVIIKASSSSVGIPAEYEYIQSIYGREGSDWEIIEQMQFDNNSKSFDMLEIKLSNGTLKTIYFDITNFYGKF